MTVINTNVKALYTQAALKMSARERTTAMQQLSTGKRINSAKDDAAGLAIASRMTQNIKSLNQAIRNAGDAISLIQTAEGATNELSNMLQRMSELAVQSSNATYSPEQRGFLDLEFQQLKQEIVRISETHEWNGTPILNGKAGTPVGPSPIYKLSSEGSFNAALSYKAGSITASGNTGTFTLTGLNKAGSVSISVTSATAATATLTLEDGTKSTVTGDVSSSGGANNISFSTGALSGLVVSSTAAFASTHKLDFSVSRSFAQVSPLVQGDVTINGTAIGATSADDDKLSTVTSAAGSSIAKVAAINRATAQTGVVAVVNPTVMAGVAMTAGAAVTGTVTINGYVSAPITTTANNTAESRLAMARAINAISTKTGVVAVDSNLDSQGLRLEAADGRNIELAFNTTGSNTSFGSATGLKQGLQSGSYSLANALNRPLTIAGTAGGAERAGLRTGVYDSNQTIISTSGRDTAKVVVGANTAPNNAAPGVAVTQGVAPVTLPTQVITVGKASVSAPALSAVVAGAAGTATTAATVTFTDLTAGQSISVGGLTFTSNQATTAAQLAEGFSNLTATATQGSTAAQALGSFTGTFAAFTTPAYVPAATAVTATSTATLATSSALTSAGSAGSTESSVISFGSLTAGQSVTLGGLTYTSLGNTTATQLAGAFGGLANGATTGAGTVTGTYSNAFTGFTTAAIAPGATAVTATSSTANTDVVDLTLTSAGRTEASVITFGALTTGQSVTVGGLTYVSNGATSAAQLAAAFASLADGATAGAGTATGIYWGALTGVTTSGVSGSTVTALSSADSTNPPDLTTSGSNAVQNLHQLGGDDLVINGVAIRASTAADDLVSDTTALSSLRAGSGIAMATAINDSTKLTGVTATANPVLTSGDFTIIGAESGAQSLYVNGVNVMVNLSPADSTAVRRQNVLESINKQFGQHGVLATDSGSGGISLSTVDGRNLSVWYDNNGTQLTAASFGLGKGPSGNQDALGVTGAVSPGAKFNAASTLYGTVSLASEQVFKVEPGSNGFGTNANFAALGFQTGTSGGVVDESKAKVPGPHTGRLSFQVGSNANQLITIDLADFGKDGLITGAITSDVYDSNPKVNISTVEGANSVIQKITDALDAVSATRATMGAVMNRLEHVIDNLTNVSTNSEASRSQIEDADYAAASTELARTQIMQQAATAVLAQANTDQQTVMKLLQ